MGDVNKIDLGTDGDVYAEVEALGVTIGVGTMDGSEAVRLTPAQARDFAAILLRLADDADRRAESGR